MSMKHSLPLKLILGLCALLIALPGAFALFSPEGFTARNGADISGVASLLNDYRSLGGMMLATGIILILGIIHKRMAFTATVVAVGMYLAMTIGRVVSIGVDGLPAKGLIAATVVEGILALLAIFALVKYRETD